MPANIHFHPITGEDNFTRLAELYNASQNADGLPLTVSAAMLMEGLKKSPEFDPERNLIIAETGGQDVAFGRLRWMDEADRRIYHLTGYVLPEWRRKGIGGEILTWLEARARAISAALPTATASFLHINVTQYQSGLHALVRKAGYEVKEAWALMVRPNLENIPESPLPEGLEVRPARPEHFPALWYAVEQAYAPEGGPAPTGKMPDHFKNSANFQPELWQVSWEMGSETVAGSVLPYINHAENKQLGILRGYSEGISTVPAWQRRGVARALIQRSLKAFRDLGMKEAALVCNPEKTGNYKLYLSCGFQEVKRDSVYEKPLNA